MELDSGNIAWMLTASAMVLFMTPGLGFFYGGLTRNKNVLATIMQSFITTGIVAIIWVTVGYSLSFGPDQGKGIIGNFDWAFLNGVTAEPGGPNGAIYGFGIPHLMFMAFQLMFAIITPALITGAFANRVTFKAYMLFLTAWLLLVYFPFVHMVWGGGILAEWGVKDFAGGIVVHNIAGIAALVEDEGFYAEQTEPPGELTERVEKLQRAVKFAREEANNHEVTQQKVGEAVFDFLFR